MPKYELDFKPREKRRMEQVGRFLLGFFSIFLLLGVVSVVVLQSNGLLDEIFGGSTEPSQTSTPEEESQGWQYTGEALFLLSETDDSGNALRFAALVRADIAQRSFAVTMLSPQAVAALPDGEITLEQAMRRGGAKELKAAVEALTGKTVGKYISSRDAGFVQAVNTMGSVPVQVPQRVEYKSGDFTLTLSAGMNHLPGDRLLRYFRYLGLQGDGLALQGELLCDLVENCLAVKYADTAKMRQRFEKLVNLVETDVNSIDFEAQADMLLALLQSGGITVACHE